VAELTTELNRLPAVEHVEFWDKERTCAEFRTLFENQPIFLENVDCMEVIPTSLRIQLGDIGRFDQITALMQCEVRLDDEGDPHQECSKPGVRSVADYQELLQRLESLRRILSLGVIVIAVIMLMAAIALVANTLRMGMFARRKEIGIMRLVGASTLYIALPFLLEALVTAMIGVGLAAGSLAAFMYFAVEQQFKNLLGFMPWVGWPEYLIAVLVVAILGPLLTLLPTLALTRKYLKV
jgi:cell division protein FtsX